MADLPSQLLPADARGKEDDDEEKTEEEEEELSVIMALLPDPRRSKLEPSCCSDLQLSPDRDPDWSDDLQLCCSDRQLSPDLDPN